MPQCLHPFEIRHPTLEKWRAERADLFLHPTWEEEEEFCRIHHIERTMKIPCGKCIYCYQRKQEMWRVRLQQEMKSSFSSYFVTLTYAPEFEPFDGVLKSDVQKFFKRFRHNMAIPLRYFLVSEYGPHNTHRPHYHFALFFNQYVGFEELLLELEKSWHSIVHLEELTDGQIDYLSTYCIKFFNSCPNGKNDNFMLCSRKPFIGHGFLSSEMCNNLRQKMQPYIQVNGFKKPIPRIYRERIFDDDMCITLREKMSAHQEKTLEDRVASFGSPIEYWNAIRWQEERDYHRAWTKYKESKKI